MALPSTPSRSEPSLTGLSSPDSPLNVPKELTPKSKVKALLAAIDDDSDFENDAQFSRPLMNELTRIPNKIPPVNDLNQHQALHDYADTDNEESDEAPIVPRGRVAARLQGHNVSRSSAGATKGQESNETPYDRIRNQLLKREETASKDNPDDFMSGAEDNFSQMPENLRSGSGEPKLPVELSGRQISSPRLFLSPKAANASKAPRSPVSNHGSGSDSDLPALSQTSNRLQLLVARKKEERRMEAVAEAQRNAEKQARYRSRPQASKNGSAHHDFVSACSSSDNSDDQVGDRRLTQQTRPTRKASKKALEEMNRETQRMSRNMQLAHQAKTKKKITKESFFTRFNFGTGKRKPTSIPQKPSSSTATSSTAASDVDFQGNESPPTSPQQADDFLDKMQESGEAMITAEDVQGVLPVDLFVVNQTSQMQSTVSSQAIHLSEQTMMQNPKKIASPRPVDNSTGVHLPKPSLRSVSIDIDSDSDLEIVPNPKPGKSRLAIFDRLSVDAVKEERSLQNLRVLAHMQHSGNRNSSSKPLLTMLDMQTSLQQRARKQAAAERAEKIQCLIDKGVIVQSTEERQKDQAEVEDLVEKARKEAQAIMEKEKNAAKTQKILNGDNIVTDLTSDEDEDYQGNDADQSDLDFSGSDEENASGIEQQDVEGEAGDELRDEDKDEHEMIVRKEASEDDMDESQNEGTSNEGPDDPVVTIPRRKPRISRFIIDDNSSENDDTQKKQLLTPAHGSVQIPLIPEIPFANALPMGLTQAFAATMAETQTQEVDDVYQGHDSTCFTEAILRQDLTMYGLDNSEQMVLDSQRSREDLDFNQDGKEDPMNAKLEVLQSQPQDHTLEDGRDLETGTQYSEIPDPTQDVGFVLSPIQSRFVSIPPSTIDTVLLSGERNTPTLKRKGRLRRGVDIFTKNIDNDGDAQPLENTTTARITADAFDVLKKAARKPDQKVNLFDKSKSEAKGLVDEQAQESEDEYAGLGGASDDETAGEEDEEVRKMIDEGEVDVDEGKLAALYADKERIKDEKAVEKLFKDLNNGGLRRKRGAEFDLSDSDDDVEARKRAKRKEFERMRKALLENENVGKIAEDPKKLAFLRAIEDREDDENLEFLEEPNNSSQENHDPQENSEHQARPQATISHPKRKRPLEDSIPNAGNRLPSSSRRTRPFKKPSTLAEIRASVSFLIEEPHAPLPNHQVTSSPPSSDNETNHQHNNSHSTSRRHTNPVIDRLSLKRAESASVSTTALAFYDPSTSANPGGFKVPSLLRRATTGQLLKAGAADKHGISTLAVTERAAGREREVVKTGGTRKSSIGYFAREKQGAKRADVTERKRAEEFKRMGRERSGLGMLATGTFE